MKSDPQALRHSPQLGHIRLPLSLRGQLLVLGFTVVALLVGSIGYLRSALDDDRQRFLVEAGQQQRLTLLRDVQQSLGDFRFWMVDSSAGELLLDSGGRDEAQRRLISTRQQLDEQLDRLSEFAPGAAATIRVELDGLPELELDALSAIISGDSARARELLDAARDRLAAIDAAMSSTHAQQRDVVEALAVDGAQAAARSLRRSLMLMIGSSALVMLLVFAVLQSTLPALRSTIAAIDELVRGRFDAPLPPVGSDELGQVALGLRQFRDNAQRLEHLARTDTLTNLANRMYLHTRIEQTLDELRNGQASAAVLFMDLDQFKSVNDALGHAAGDRFLQEVGRRLRRALPGADVVARLSGDEFGVLLRQAGGVEHMRESAGAAAEAVIRAFAQPYTLENQPLSISASFGITVAQRDGWSADALLSHAEAAMYAAKGEGRSRLRFYSPDLTDHIRENLAIGNELRRAISADSLELHYQPVVRIGSGELVSAEALLRWNHPRLGPLPPSRFVPIAEETQTVLELGGWVINAACTQIASWRKAGYRSVPIAVNISARHFADDGLVHRLEQTLVDTGLPRGALEMELTESAVVADPKRSAAVMRELRGLGVRLSLDDFGTGYSSLSYLQSFRLDKLKIDQSFVRQVLENSESDTIVSATIGLAKRLGMATVGEGIESAAVLTRMAEHGCDLAQGYHTGRPMPAKAFEAWLRARCAPEGAA